MSLNITSIIPSEIQKLEDEMRSLTEMILKEFSKSGKINLKLVSDEEMMELNHKFRDKNKTRKFKITHTVSVIINFVQIFLLVAVII